MTIHNGRSWWRTALLLAEVVLASSVCTTPIVARSPASPAQAADRAMVSELVAIVGQHGWPANMGRMCVALKLASESDCKFTQIAVSGSESDTIGKHGFNVPVDISSSVRYVLIFHLKPLVGNFFIVSPDGTLKRSYYRAKGVDYTEIPNDDARRAFETSLAFWRQNLPKLKEMIAAGNPPRR